MIIIEPRHSGHPISECMGFFRIEDIYCDNKTRR